MKYSYLLISILLTFAVLTGCATTPRPNPAIAAQQPAATESTPDSTPELEVAVPPKGIQMASTQPFANRVDWPENDTNSQPFNIKSGVDDEVWIEGKGYFNGTLADVYQDLTNEQIIGPTHMTRDIERAEFSQTELKTSYVMHIKMKYILPIKFDLSVTIEPLFDGNTLAGYLYRSEKTSGTTFIKVISDTILIKKLDENRFSVEFQSINVATQDKEEEARAHAEALFAHWTEAGQSRIAQPGAVTCETPEPSDVIENVQTENIQSVEEPTPAEQPE